jgi:arginyl-tRNA synthetase
MKDHDMTEEEKKTVSRDVAVAGIKFSILKQNFRKNIIFDKEKALSLEGDSGPYIQYAIVRINSIEKKTEGVTASDIKSELSSEAQNLMRTVWRYNHMCYKAIDEFAPQYIAQYLIDLASRFNSFYSKNKIIEDEKVHKELLDLCVKTREVLTAGLTVLGIRVVEKM